MNEPKAQEVTPVEPLSMDVKVYPTKTEGNTMAFASVKLGGCFAVNSIRIMNGEKGLFLAMPDRQDNKGERRDVCFPTTKEMRAALNTAVLNEYQRVMELMAERGAKARASVREALQTPAKKAAPEKAPPAAEKAPRQRKADKGAR